MRSVKQECLRKLVLFGDGSLRRALNEYLAHFHGERNHQGKGNVLLFPQIASTDFDSPTITRTPRLGGLLGCSPPDPIGGATITQRQKGEIAQLRLELRTEIQTGSNLQAERGYTHDPSGQLPSRH